MREHDCCLFVEGGGRAGLWLGGEVGVGLTLLVCFLCLADCSKLKKCQKVDVQSIDVCVSQKDKNRDDMTRIRNSKSVGQC